MKTIATFCALCASMLIGYAGIVPPMTITNGAVETYYSPDIGYIYVQPMAVVNNGVTNAIFANGFCGFGEFKDRAITNSAGEVLGWECDNLNPVKFQQQWQTRQLRWRDDDPLEVLLPNGTWYQPVVFKNAIWTNAP